MIMINIAGVCRNTHLDEAYGGYCVFAEVGDAASFAVVDQIAEMVKAGRNTQIARVSAI